MTLTEEERAWWNRNHQHFNRDELPRAIQGALDAPGQRPLTELEEFWIRQRYRKERLRSMVAERVAERARTDQTDPDGQVARVEPTRRASLRPATLPSLSRTGGWEWRRAYHDRQCWSCSGATRRCQVQQEHRREPERQPPMRGRARAESARTRRQYTGSPVREMQMRRAESLAQPPQRRGWDSRERDHPRRRGQRLPASPAAQVQRDPDANRRATPRSPAPGQNRQAGRGAPRTEAGPRMQARRRRVPRRPLPPLQGPPCLLYTSPSPRDGATSRMPSSA